MTEEKPSNGSHPIPVNREVLIQELTALIGEALPELPHDIDASADLFEAGLDSMAIMQLLIFLEDCYHVEIPPEAVTRENFSNVNSLAALLNKRRPV